MGVAPRLFDRHRIERSQRAPDGGTREAAVRAVRFSPGHAGRRAGNKMARLCASTETGRERV